MGFIYLYIYISIYCIIIYILLQLKIKRNFKFPIKFIISLDFIRSFTIKHVMNKLNMMFLYFKSNKNM